MQPEQQLTSRRSDGCISENNWRPTRRSGLYSASIAVQTNTSTKLYTTCNKSIVMCAPLHTPYHGTSIQRCTCTSTNGGRSWLSSTGLQVVVSRNCTAKSNAYGIVAVRSTSYNTVTDCHNSNITAWSSCWYKTIETWFNNYVHLTGKVKTSHCVYKKYLPKHSGTLPVWMFCHNLHKQITGIYYYS